MFSKPFNARHYQIDFTRDDRGAMVYLDIFRQGRHGGRRELVTELRRIDARNPMRRNSDRDKHFLFTDARSQQHQVMGIKNNSGELAHEQIFDILVINDIANPNKPLGRPMSNEKQYSLAELQKIYDSLRHREQQLTHTLNSLQMTGVTGPREHIKFQDVSAAYEAIKSEAAGVERLVRRLREVDPSFEPLPTTLDAQRSQHVSNLIAGLM